MTDHRRADHRKADHRKADHRQDARRALLDAFSELALSRRYSDFGVDLIRRKARVARSTFYYHFREKDELLVENLAPMIAAAAALPLQAAPTPDIEHWTLHLWHNRAVANRLAGKPAARKIAGALTEALAATLATPGARTTDDRSVAVLAHQIAGAMTGLLQAWLAGRVAGSPAEIAHALWAGARALAAPPP